MNTKIEKPIKNSYHEMETKKLDTWERKGTQWLSMHL